MKIYSNEIYFNDHHIYSQESQIYQSLSLDIISLFKKWKLVETAQFNCDMRDNMI